jgi:putative acetyltransferase
MRVRRFDQRDATALAHIFFCAIHEIASSHYSAEQIRAWAPNVPDPQRFIARGADGRVLLVAVDEDDQPLAYGDIEPNGHIDHLFCRPDLAGTGVTAKLYEALEEAAKKLGIRELFVEASIPAQRFFTKRGFTTKARNDFDLERVPMHNFRMVKQLEV